MRRVSESALVAVTLGVVTAVLAVWYYRRPELPSAQPVQEAHQAAAAAPAASANEPIEHPIEAVAEDAASQRPIPSQGIEAAMAELFGRKTLDSVFRLDDFPRRVAATVDSLARSYSSSQLWPVNPTTGHFTVRTEGDVTTIDPDNGQRYTSFVLLCETVDLRKLAALYRRMYPLLQSAYTELGYPGRHFNNRVVAVVDQLLATPEPAGPLQVTLPSFGAGVQPTRPWVLYRFSDPQLEALSSGQKILLRTGPVNERRLKARLSELRGLLTARGGPAR